MGKEDKLIGMIQIETDPIKLNNWINNARRKNAAGVEQAAIKQLVSVMALNNHDNPDDPMVLDFWKSITALEFVLSDERGKTTRLARTRQKITRVGVKKTLEDLTLSATPSEGYSLLRDRGMLDMSAESVVIRHAHAFDSAVLDAAKIRIAANQDPTGD